MDDKIFTGVKLAVTAVALYLVYVLFKKFGVIPDKANTEAKNAANENKSFDIKYWFKNKAKPESYLTDNQAIELASKMHKITWGYARIIISGGLNSDVSDFKGAMRLIKSKVSASKVSYYYYNKFKTNVMEDIQQFTSASNATEIYNYFNNLPDA